MSAKISSKKRFLSSGFVFEICRLSLDKNIKKVFHLVSKEPIFQLDDDSPTLLTPFNV